MFNKFNKSLTPLAVLISTALALPTAAIAQNTQLDQLVVTATRTKTPQNETLSSTSVITRADIERNNYQTIADAISGLAGVVISNSGGLGKQTSLFLRGTESNHTQILLNGSKLATNEFGAPQIEHIPINQIERIELVRGPQSSLYGSSSIGGTIQIFTKAGSDGFKPHASVGYGTHNTKTTDAGFSAGNEAAWLNISAGYKESDGFDSCDGRSASLFIGCFTDEPDNDSYRNKNSAIRAGMKLGDVSNADVYSLYTAGTVEYDGFFNETDFKQHTYGVNFDTELTNFWSLKTNLSRAIFEADNFGDGNFDFAYNEKNAFSIQNDFRIHRQTILSIGYDFEDDKLETQALSDISRNNKGFFTQLINRSGKNDFRVALRIDDNEQFGHNTTGNIAWGRALTDNLKFYTSYGEAFTAPSLIDLFSSFSGNSDLEPETSKTYEVGFKGQSQKFTWSVAAYETKIENLILATFSNSFVPENISEANIRGLEITGFTSVMGVNLRSQLSLMDPENRSDDENRNNVLARRAEQTFTLNAHKQFGKFSLGSELFVSGKRYDDAANTRELGSFTTVDFISTYQLSNSTNIQMRVANLFDEEYETVAGYNTDGTNLLLSINYRP